MIDHKGLHRFSLRAGVCFCALMTMASGAGAQTTTAVPDQATSSGAAAAPADDQSGEIIVTGQKRAESVQDVPKQVAVASQEQLSNAGVTRITDLQTVFPTITPTSQAQNSQNPGIRGIAPISGQIGVSSQTGIIVDDFPQATFSTLAFELTDLERVEVFAGPQSTLSGRNAASGLINFVTRSPSNTPSLDFRFEQTSDRQTRGSIFATGPVTSNLAYSLSLLINKWAGPLRNRLLSNEALGGFDTKGIRGKLKWEPDDRLTLQASGFYIDTRRETPPVIVGGLLVSAPSDAYMIFDTQRRSLGTLFSGLQLGASNRSVYSPENGVAFNRDRGGTFRLDYRFGSLGTASLLTGYTDSRQPRNDVFFGAPRDNLVIGTPTDFNATVDVISKHFTQEARLTSPSSGPFTYLLGAIYTDTRLAFPYQRLGVFRVPRWYRTVRTEGEGLFGRATYDVTAADSVTAGLRYQTDKLSYTWDFFGPATGTGPATTVTNTSQSSSRHGFLAGEASYKHKFSERINAYVTYAQTQTGEAYDMEDNADAIVGKLQPLKSAKAKSVEIGFKSELFDRRLTFNANVFRIEYRNYQFSSIDASDVSRAPVIRLLSIGKVRSQGAEMNASLRVTSDLRLNVNGAYTDATIRAYPGAGCYNTQTQAQGCNPAPAGSIAGTPSSQNINGLLLPYTSKWKINGGFDYKIAVSDRIDVRTGAFVRYQSTQHSDVLGDPLSYQKGFSTVNIYAGPVASNGKWSVQFFVNNLFDKRYYATVARSTFFARPSGVADVQAATYDRNSFRYGGVRLGIGF